VDYYTGFGSVYEPRNVIPTAGSSAALYIALASVLEEGDEVLMWSPSYRGHYRILDEMGVKASVAPLKRETGYHPHLETLEDYVVRAGWARNSFYTVATPVLNTQYSLFSVNSEIPELILNHTEVKY